MKTFSSTKMLKDSHPDYTDDEYKDIQNFITGQHLRGDKVAMDVKPTWLTSISTANAVLINSTNRVILKTSHGALKGDVLRFTDGDNIGIEATVLSVPTADIIILASKLEDAPTAGELFDILRPVTPTTSASGLLPISVPELDVVDMIDTTPLLSVAGATIPKSSSLPLEIVASLAARCVEIEITEDVGEYIGLYTGAAGAEVLKTILPIAGGNRKLVLPAGTRISIGHMKDTDIATATFFAINFLG